MTSQELKQQLIENSYPEWYKEVKVTFSFQHINYTLPLTGITAIYEYVEQQVAGWDKIKNLPQELNVSYSYFHDIQNEITKFITKHLGSDIGSVNNGWQLVLNAMGNMRNAPMPYDAPEAVYLVKIHEENPDYFKGAFETLAGESDLNVRNRYFLFGAILAYEFKLKDNTDITSRVDAEQKSMTSLRNEFHKYLTESESQLTDYLQILTENYNSHIKKIDELTTAKQLLFDNWFIDNQDKKWNPWFNETSKKLAALKTTYEEQLKFEEPGKYWKIRGESLKKEGWKTLWIVVTLVVLTCTTLLVLLFHPPEQLLKSWFGDDKSAAIRWSLIYFTFLSFIAFCIKSLTKAMFSAFHLSRDSEERYTLTYFYLSLLKDRDIESAEKQLILQSLFSRADSGLLKEDSSPVMPKDAIGKFTAK